jgi:hypothetical protein
LRDYIVLWNRLSGDASGRYWFPTNPGPQSAPGGFQQEAEKVYVPMPNEKTLTAFFNHSVQYDTNNAFLINGFYMTYAGGWQSYFGGNRAGGWSDLTLVPTSDAFGALYGRPARDPATGKFITQKY